MKKIIAIISIITLLVVAFTGCTSNKSMLLENNTTSVEKQTVAEVEPSIFLWIDESTSISAEEMQVLIQMTREYTGLKKAYGPYPFGGGAYGSETANGWTDLVEPLKASGHNSKVYIFTDGHQENPEGFNQRSFAGPYWGLEVHYVCLEKNRSTEQLKEALENSKEYFKGSTVILEYIDGASRDVIIDEFETQGIEISYEDNDTLYSLSKNETTIPWWIWLIPLLLLLIPLLWWLLRRRKKEEASEGNVGGIPSTSAGTATATPTGATGVNRAADPSRLTTRPTSEIAGAIAPTAVEPESSPTATTIPKAPESQNKCCCCCPYQQKKINNNTLAIVAIACVAIVAIATVALVLATI